MNKRFNIYFNEIWEFHYTLVLAAYEDVDYLFRDYIKFNRVKEVEVEKRRLQERNKAIREKLSLYMKNELKFFFSEGSNLCNGIGQIILYRYICENPEIQSIKEMIKVIAKDDSLNIARFVFENTYNSSNVNKIYELAEWKCNKNNIEWMINLCKTFKFANKDIKERVFECIENCEEVKERLIILLKRFYEKIYKILCANVNKELMPYMKIYESELNTNEEQFFKKYGFKGIENFSKEVDIHVTYSKTPGIDYWASEKDKKEYIIIGSYTNEYIKSESNDEELMDFLKVIADAKRIKILKILKEGPKYVNEIAEIINMTAPTVSYHLSILQDFGIVEYERIDHRFYYEIKIEKLREWFDKAKNNLI